MEYLFAAILAIEGWRGPGTVGGAGEIGPYQITKGYWQDSGIPGSHLDCESKEYSERVMLAYWKRYCPEALRTQDLATLASVHHWGPKGAKVQVSYRDDYVARAMGIVNARRAG
jgi:hypothetical protein